MDVIATLFSQYSLESLILLVIMLGVGMKAVMELAGFFYDKFRKHFNYQNQKDQAHNQIIESIEKTQKSIQEVKEDVSSVSEEVRGLKGEVEKLKDQSEISVERMQESTRSYIIDKHHYFCNVVQAIDDLNLQSLERRFLYYKQAGGNSFIDGLMADIRQLPRVNLQDRDIVDVVKRKNEERS